MFRLDRHIEILLLNHDCVVLPGFGGFVAHHVSACLDEEDGVMLPPKTTVGFNARLAGNDSLLAQSYVEAYDYSFPEALRVVEDEVAQLRDMIGEYGRFEFHSVGVITLNDEGNYEFEPAQAGILTPSLCGLSGVDTNDAGTFITRRESRQAQDVRSYLDGTEDEEHFIRISTRALRRAAVALVAVLVILAIPFLNQNVNRHELLSRLDASFFTNLIPNTERKANCEKGAAAKSAALTPKESSENLVADSEAVALEVEPATTDPSVAEKVGEPTFTVVLAARVSKKNADNYVEQLHKHGKTEARVVGEGTSRKVVYGSFGTEEEAHAAKRQIAASEGVASAWVTKIR